MTVRQVLRLIRDDGWYHAGTTGGHRQFKHPSKPGRVTVSGAMKKDIPPKTLSSILKQAGLKD